MPETIREERRTVSIGQFENSVLLEAEFLLMRVMSIGKAARDVNHELIHEWIPHGSTAARGNQKKDFFTFLKKGFENYGSSG